MTTDQLNIEALLGDDKEARATTYHELVWAKVLKEAIKTVAELEPKHVAPAPCFDMSTTALHHALAERNRTRLSAQQLVYLMVQSKHITLASVVPNIREHKLVPMEPMTPEEECARWRSLADQMGVVGQGMKKMIYDGKVKP